MILPPVANLLIRPAMSDEELDAALNAARDELCGPRIGSADMSQLAQMEADQEEGKEEN
jgi:hypothetical protein